MSESVEPNAPYFVAGGTLSAQAPSYVEREADARLLTALKQGEFCYVLNSRQMGKSSICVRTMARLADAGVQTVFIDLTKIGGKNVTVEQWFAGVAVEIGRNLGIRAEILTYWKENSELSAVQRLFGAIRDVALEHVQAQLVIFFDEIDATRSLSFSADEFFAAIRECYNRRVQDPALKRLGFCLLGVALPSDLIQNPTATPFNVGVRILLRDFTLEETMAFAAGLTPPRSSEQAAAIIKRVYWWTSGHPYLTQSLCAAISADQALQTERDVDDLVKSDLLEPTARETNINLADVSNRALHAGDAESDPEKFRSDLLTTYERALRGKTVPDDESNHTASVLKLAGLMRPEGNHLIIRNRIYSSVFNIEWVNDNMPGQELRRQRQSYFLGVIRTAVVGGIVIAIVGALAVRLRYLADAYQHLADVASRDRIQAVRAERVAEYQAYVADLAAMRTAETDQNYVHLGRLLNDTANSPYRGLEWDYWKYLLFDCRAQTAFPGYRGRLKISADGKQIELVDSDTRKGAVYSYPDLVKRADIPTLASSSSFNFFGGDWALVSYQTPETMLITNASDGHEIKRLALPIGSRVGAQDVSNPTAFAVAWAPPRGATRNVTIVPADSAGPNLDFTINSGDIQSVRVADGGRIAIVVTTQTVDSPATAVYVDMVNHREIGTYMPVGGFVAGMAISASGRYAAFGSLRGLLTVYDIPHQKVVFQRTDCRTGVSEIAISHDDKLVVAQGDQTVRAYDIAGDLICVKPGGSSFELAPDAKTFAVTGVGCRVYDIAPAVPTSASIARAPALAMGFDPTGRLALAVLPSSVRFIDPSTLRTVGTAKVPLRQFYGSAKAFAALENGHVALYVADASRRLCTLESLTALPRDLTVSRDGASIVAIDTTKPRICGFDHTGKLLWSQAPSGKPWMWCAQSGDGLKVVTQTSDLVGVVLDGRTGRPLKRFQWPNGNGRGAFSHQGHRFAFTINNEARMLDLDSQTPEIVFAGHSSQLLSVAFSADDSRVLTASLDGTARLWDSESGSQLLQLGTGKGALTAAVFDEKGEHIFTSDELGFIQKYKVGPKVMPPSTP